MSKLVQRLLLATLTPALLLVAVEVVVRLTDGAPRRGTLFHSFPAPDGTELWQREPAKNVPWYPPYRVAKPDGVIRIACVGGSTVVGVPFPELAFPAVLQQMLREMVRGVTIEVIACGVGGLYSDGEANALREVLALSPDIVVLYSCHNEFHPRNVATLLARALHPYASASEIQDYLVAHTATHAALTRAIRGEVKPFESVAREAPDHRPIDGPEYQLVVDNFRSFLADFADTCNDRDITCVLCTAVSNLRDFPPMADVFGRESTADERARCKALWEQSLETSRSGDFTNGLRLAEEAAAIDPTPASVDFALGTALLGLGRIDEARDRFRRARDHDGRLNRSPTPLNAAVREAAAVSGALLADVEARFEGLAPNGIVGDEWIIDNVHPNLAGQALIARVILEALARAEKLVTQADLARLPAAPPRPESLTPADTEERIAFANLILALEKGGKSLTTVNARKHFERALAIEKRPSAILGLGILDALEEKRAAAAARFREAHALDPKCFEVYADAAAKSRFVEWLFKSYGIRFDGRAAVIGDPPGR